MKYFAMAMPGVGTVLAEEASRRPELSVANDYGFDGRNDIVSFSADGLGHQFNFHSSEDVLVEVASSRATGELGRVVRDLTDEAALGRALSVYAQHVRPLRPAMRYRVITRLLSERIYRRTQLRDALSTQLGRQRPRWRLSDPADVELWALETKSGRLRSGLRLTDASMRHRGNRAVERGGALRPSVAGAMIVVAEPPAGARLLDPFCGSGTILGEAVRADLQAIGFDIDPAAVSAAQRNVDGVTISEADARQLPLDSNSIDLVVSNLPFGSKHRLPDNASQWCKTVLTELNRVVRPGQPVVLLMPASATWSRAISTQSGLLLVREIPIRLLGYPTSIWHLRG